MLKQSFLFVAVSVVAKRKKKKTGRKCLNPGYRIVPNPTENWTSGVINRSVRDRGKCCYVCSRRTYS